MEGGGEVAASPLIAHPLPPGPPGGILTRMRLAILAIFAVATSAGAQAGNEWPAWGGDLAATKYSTLTDINRGNVAQLDQGVGVGDGRDAEHRAAHSPRKLPGDAAHDRRHAVSQHVVQPRRRARREHRPRVVGVRSESVCSPDSRRMARASCIAASRRGPTASSGESS